MFLPQYTEAQVLAWQREPGPPEINKSTKTKRGNKRYERTIRMRYSRAARHKKLGYNAGRRVSVPKRWAESRKEKREEKRKGEGKKSARFTSFHWFIQYIPNMYNNTTVDQRWAGLDCIVQAGNVGYRHMPRDRGNTKNTTKPGAPPPFASKRPSLMWKQKQKRGAKR